MMPGDRAVGRHLHGSARDSERNAQPRDADVLLGGRGQAHRAHLQPHLPAPHPLPRHALPEVRAGQVAADSGNVVCVLSECVLMCCVVLWCNVMCWVCYCGVLCNIVVWRGAAGMRPWAPAPGGRPCCWWPCCTSCGGGWSSAPRPPWSRSAPTTSPLSGGSPPPLPPQGSLSLLLLILLILLLIIRIRPLLLLAEATLPMAGREHTPRTSHIYVREQAAAKDLRYDACAIHSLCLVSSQLR